MWLIRAGAWKSSTPTPPYPMKQKMALLALAFIMMFGLTADVTTAAVTATTGVSINPISLNNAYYRTEPDHLNVTENPGQIFVSFRITDDGGYFPLNSIIVDVTINGIPMSSESYSSWDMTGSVYGRIGFYGPDYYTSGLMNTGSILDGYGSRNSSSPYTTSLTTGDVWQVKMTYNIQGQEPITSTGTVNFVPEPTSCILAALSTLVFLRRKR